MPAKAPEASPQATSAPGTSGTLGTSGTPIEVKALPVRTPEELAPALEALVLSLDRPAGLARLAGALGLEGPGGAGLVRDAIDALNRAYEDTGRSFRIEQVAGGFRVMTLPKFAPAIEALHESRASARLSRAAVETLAVIAYRQPITRAEIEAIRGVACGEVLRTLLERRLAAITGRAEEVGRPMLYGTSRAFLETFGLASVKDLPPVGDFAAFTARAPAAHAAQDETEPKEEQGDANG